MDLPLYARVLWRFRVLVGGGVLAAILLSLLAVVRVSPSAPHFAYRQNQEFSSQATLFVTQQGFPWGYAAPPTVSPNATPQADASTEAKALGAKQFADPTRFPSLAVLYAYLAMSDPVKRIMLRHGPVDGQIVAQPVVVTSAGYVTTLPLVAIAATTTSPASAKKLAVRATDAFRQFLETQQAKNQIPAQNRVLVTILTRAEKPKLVKGRSKTLPLVVFVTVITAVIGLAFLLENMRPRVRPVREDEVVVAAQRGRQSA
jgi:hypothetical protein